MNNRLRLHSILCRIMCCPECGDNCRVYFQPPASIEMKYDCIRYERAEIDTNYADNNPYKFYNRYQLTLIYRNPDSKLPQRIAELPMCSHERHYTSDNLHHDIFNLYF